jgi:type I restriction enzyme S subunit
MMAKWRDCKMGDLLEIKHGFAFLGEHFGSSGTHVVLTPGNFLEEGGFKEKADKAKWYNGPIPDDYVLSEGDLIIAMTEQAEGLLGSSALIPRSGVYLHNQRLGLVQIRDPKLADRHFIYYLFNSKLVRQQIRGSASGTKIRHTAPSRIADVKVSVPPMPVQRRIASILSAYDELIENSQRRIRILETMARALYREWFVHFRFPGHERTRIVDGLPMGWERKSLEEVAEFRLGKMLDQAKNRGDLRPYLANVNVRWGEFDLQDLREMRFEQDELETYGLKFGDIVMCEGGEPGRCAIWKEQIPGMMIQKAIHRIRCRANMNHIYLYHSLRDQGESGHLAALFTGATIKHLPREKLAKVTVVVPAAPLLKKFGDATMSMEEQVETLQRQIQNLRRTRDLLLPRLVSGQVNPGGSCG